MSRGYPTISSADASVGDESSNAITVSFQLYDADGDELSEAGVVGYYTTSDAAGQVPHAAQTSIAAGTDGAVLEATSATAGVAISEADGDLDLVVTDTGTSTVYLHLTHNGLILVTATLPFAA